MTLMYALLINLILASHLWDRCLKCHFFQEIEDVDLSTHTRLQPPKPLARSLVSVITDSAFLAGKFIRVHRRGFAARQSILNTMKVAGYCAISTTLQVSFIQAASFWMCKNDLMFMLNFVSMPLPRGHMPPWIPLESPGRLSDHTPGLRNRFFF